VPNSFVTALKEVFDGLQSVAVKRSDLDAALTEGGLPCTVEALKERFDAYVQTITKGKDLSKVRIVIE
jgi:hypothetical protein